MEDFLVIANNSTSLSKFDEEISKVKITFTREGSGGAPSSVKPVFLC